MSEVADDSRAELDRLKADLARLSKDNASLLDELKDVRHEARDRRHEAKSLAEQLAALARERDELKVKAEADPEGLRKQLDESRGVIRGLKHESAYAKIAKTLRVNDPAKLTDLIKLAAYEPEADEPDDAKIAERFGAALKGRPWLLDADAQTTNAAGAATTAPGGQGATSATAGQAPGPGADRGQSLESSSRLAATRVPGRL